MKVKVTQRAATRMPSYVSPGIDMAAYNNRVTDGNLGNHQLKHQW